MGTSVGRVVVEGTKEGTPEGSTVGTPEGSSVGTGVGRADGLSVGLSVGSCVGQSRLFVAVLRNAVRDTPGSPAERPRTHKTRPQNAKALSPMLVTVVGMLSKRASEQLKKEEFLMALTVSGIVITWNRLQSKSAG